MLGGVLSACMVAGLLSLDKLLNAVLAEAQVVCVGQPMLFEGDFLMLTLALFLAWPRALVLAGWLTWRLLIR